MIHWLSVAVAVVFTWLGMVVAISFLEVPLKFRTPGVTLQLGLAIGRRVYRGLNSWEVALAFVALATVILGSPPLGVGLGILVAVAALGIQLVAVRPGLTRHSDAVLAGVVAPVPHSRSRGHHAYVAFEVIKVVALLTSGIQMLL